MWYAILDGKVIDKAVSSFPTSNEIIWVEDAGDYEIGYRYNSQTGEFSAPDKPEDHWDYMEKRKVAYGDPFDLLLMIYEDKKAPLGAGTSFQDYIDSVNQQYPKPN